jgi:hypothetical protein
MIEFDVQCRLCGMPMTLQVLDERARAAFEEDGALCDVCYELDYRSEANGAVRRATQRGGGSDGSVVRDEPGGPGRPGPESA